MASGGRYGLFAFTLQFGLLFAGMQAGMPTGLASLVIQVQAFFTIGLVAVLTHERAKPIQLIGATIAGAGLVLVAFHLPPSTRSDSCSWWQPRPPGRSRT